MDTAYRLQLADLGLAPVSVRALAMLPLVAIAWADGAIQSAERQRILDFAEEVGGLDEEGATLLQDWLRHAPTPSYVQTGIELMCVLIARGEALFGDRLLDRMMEEAEAVAASAGSGLMGLFSKVSREEKDALGWLDRVLKEARAAASDDGDASGTKALAHRKTTMADDDDEDEEDVLGVLVLEGPDRRKFRVTTMGVVVGSAAGHQVIVPGLSATHFKLLERRRRYYIEALDGRAPVLVNGERVGFRRVLGGETIIAGKSTFTFKMAHRG